MATQVGFIGLGLMGAPMAHNLLKAGYPLTVWNRTAAKMAPLTEAGATPAESPEDLAGRVEIVFTMLTDAPQVREVALGQRGIVHGAKPGTIVIDTSSIAPSAARDIAQELGARQIEMLDAPVSGGVSGATEGTLSIMVGGEEEMYTVALPVLRAVGKTIAHVGPQGTGQLVKLCNQTMVALNLLAVAEALVLARQAGANLETVCQALLGGAARSWILENLGPKMRDGDYRPGFTVANIQKDLRNVLQEAAGLDVPLPGTALVHQLYRANQAAGESQDGHAALHKVLLRLAGETPR